MKVYPVLQDVLMEQLGHFVVHRRHNLVQHFNEGNRKTSVTEVFSHFKANKASADDSGCFNFVFFNKSADAVSIRNRPKRLDTGRSDSRNGWADR